MPPYVSLAPFFPAELEDRGLGLAEADWDVDVFCGSLDLLSNGVMPAVEWVAGPRSVGLLDLVSWTAEGEALASIVGFRNSSYKWDLRRWNLSLIAGLASCLQARHDWV